MDSDADDITPLNKNDGFTARILFNWTRDSISNKTNLSRHVIDPNQKQKQFEKSRILKSLTFDKNIGATTILILIKLQQRVPEKE